MLIIGIVVFAVVGIFNGLTQGQWELVYVAFGQFRGRPSGDRWRLAQLNTRLE